MARSAALAVAGAGFKREENPACWTEACLGTLEGFRVWGLGVIWGIYRGILEGSCRD